MGNPSHIDDREIKITNEGRILVDSKNTSTTSFFQIEIPSLQNKIHPIEITYQSVIQMKCDAAFVVAEIMAKQAK